MGCASVRTQQGGGGRCSCGSPPPAIRHELTLVQGAVLGHTDSDANAFVTPSVPSNLQKYMTKLSNEECKQKVEIMFEIITVKVF